MRLHKNFLITEGKSLQFRFEALNAFNHPVWTFSGGPASGSFDPGSPIFGQITGSQSARSLQHHLLRIGGETDAGTNCTENQKNRQKKTYRDIFFK